MARVFESKSDLLGAVGETLGTSEWLEITREMVHQFADATGDHQWIHVDDERAKRESPFGGPIAHGYLTLSLIPVLSKSVYRIKGPKLLVNYGSDKVRFPSPVPVGSRVRNTVVLTSVEELPNGSLQSQVTNTVEIEGSDKPAVVAITVTRIFF
ncbi:enoyl-CoA hydratase [Rhodococcus sp. SRB_17]|uniref:MaoC family dehydratase n=1 Tax=Rhodococcus sp. OK302 TaxID=1882769 RepID=UPI000B9421D6|nr:MaoC family dehydratase [Rhodococcus sp. OK302]NMM83056.1 enoyl-CoA hydratase [Rhodococcus sp. SRB_17]OYD67992.1 acyl dehydratase [Rhodococcus sp. OK302]